MICNGASIHASGVTLFGNSNSVNGNGCTITGNSNSVRGNNSNVIGNSNSVIGNDCKITGDSNSVNGNGCGIKGNSCSVIGNDNIIEGDHTCVRGNRNSITGDNTLLNGDNNIVFGNNTVNNGNNNTINGTIVETEEGGSFSLNNQFSGSNVIMNFRNFQSRGRFQFGNNSVMKMVKSNFLPRKKMKKKKMESKIKFSELQEANDDTPEQLVCIVCTEFVKNTIFDPCGHSCTCLKCSKKIMDENRKCPICREKIKEVKPLYL